jgi:hypothetical protein
VFSVALQNLGLLLLKKNDFHHSECPDDDKDNHHGLHLQSNTLTPSFFYIAFCR